jgi:predicted nucleotidyltransferase
MMTQTDHEIAGRLKALMVERGLPFEKVIVYGSRARGDFEEDSDLDVLVVVPERTLDLATAIRQCAWEVGFDSERYVQTVIRPKSETENSTFALSPFMQVVNAEGILI